MWGASSVQIESSAHFRAEKPERRVVPREIDAGAAQAAARSLRDAAITGEAGRQRVHRAKSPLWPAVQDDLLPSSARAGARLVSRCEVHRRAAAAAHAWRSGVPDGQLPAVRHAVPARSTGANPATPPAVLMRTGPPLIATGPSGLAVRVRRHLPALCGTRLAARATQQRVWRDISLRHPMTAAREGGGQHASRLRAPYISSIHARAGRYSNP